jgi:hypothetical protein
VKTAGVETPVAVMVMIPGDGGSVLNWVAVPELLVMLGLT